MHVTEAGNGRPLIFLHGWSCHGGFFAPQVGALQQDFHLLLPDLPGHRNSTVCADMLSIPHLADALQAFIAERGLKNVVLAGWSMGALVAFDYIARYGSKALGALVIEDMTPRIVNDGDWSFGIRNGFDMNQSTATVLAMQADWPGYVSAFLPRMFARSGCHDMALQNWAGDEIRNNQPAAMAALWASMAGCDFRSLMPRIDLPVLILHGEESQLYDQEVSVWLESSIPKAERHAISGSGHSPHLEQPYTFNAVLKAFASRF